MADPVDFPVGAEMDAPEAPEAPTSPSADFWEAAAGIDLGTPEDAPTAPQELLVGSEIDAPAAPEVMQVFYRASALEGLYRSAQWKDPDQHARVLAAKKATGAPVDLVEANIEGFERAMKMAGGDGLEFVRQNRVLTDILFKDREAAPLIFAPPEQTLIQKLHIGMQDLGHLAYDFAAPGKRKYAESPVTNVRQFLNLAAPGETSIPDEKTIADRDAYLATPQPLIDAREDTFWGRTREFTKRAYQEQITRAGLGGALLNLVLWERMLAPENQNSKEYLDKKWALEKEIADFDEKLAPTDFGARGVETLLGEALNLVPSQAASLTGGLGVATVGGALTYGAALAITRNPTAAAAAASTAWGIGGATGAFASSFWLERGNAYLDMKRQGMDDEFAIPMSNVYGVAVGITETLALKKFLEIGGPVTELAKSLSRRKFNEAMLKDATMGRIFERFLQKYGTGVLAESSQEAFQDLLQDSSTYLGMQMQRYGTDVTKWDSPDIHGSIDSAAETFIKTGIGTAILGLPLGGASIASQVNHAANMLMKDEAYAGASKVRAIIDFVRGSQLARAKPNTVADLIKGESARSGLPVDTLYIPAEKFMRVFQEDEARGDWEAAAMELGGQPLVDRIKAAAATGDRIAIPIEDYVAKWAGKPIAEALANDTAVRQYAPTANDIIAKRDLIASMAKQFKDEYLKTKPPPKSDAERAAMEMFLSDQARTVMDPKDADTAMELFRAFVHTQAFSFAQDAKPGQTPLTAEQLFAEYVVTAHRERAANAVAATEDGGVKIHQADASVVAKQLASEGRFWTSFVDEDGNRTFVSTGADGSTRVDRAMEVDDAEYGSEGALDSRSQGNIDLDPALGSSTVEAARLTAAPSASDIQTIREETGAPVREDGTLNGAEILERLYQTRDFEKWFDVFQKNPTVRKMYTAEDLQSLRDSMFMARQIFQKAIDDNILPEEMEYDSEGKALSPLRINADFWKSLDITTICPRQDIFTAIIHEVERQRDDLLTPEQRHLVGLMLRDAGAQPACWYCYGQAGRNAYDAVVKTIASVAKQYVALMSGPTKPTQAQVLELFRPASGDRRWNPKGKLAVWLKDNWKALAKEGIPSEVKLRDIARGYAKGNTALEVSFGAAARAHAQGSTHANDPKGWATLKTQILRISQRAVDFLNRRAGLRMNSQTDFRPWHILETTEAIASMFARKLMAHVYTKETAFLKVFGKTGIKFNLSALYVTRDGKVVLDERGLPTFDPVAGMAGADIEYWIKELPGDAGGMLLATSDDALLLGLADQRIHMIIPYHAGSVPGAVDEMEGARDYSSFQHEKGWTTREVPGTNLKKPPIEVQVAGQWYLKGKPVQIKVKGKKITVYAGESLDASNHLNDQEFYFAVCRQLGLTPKFGDLDITDSKGEVSRLVEKDEKGNWTAKNSQYMKLIRDVARNPETQTVPNPARIDWDAAYKVEQEWIDQGGDKLDAPKALVEYVSNRIEKGLWPKKGTAPSPEEIDAANKKIKAAKAKAASRGLKMVPGLISAQEARLMEEDKGVVRGWTDTLREGVKKVLRIALTEHANKSTFLHESGHVFLKLMADLAHREDAPERLKKDFAATIAWLDADPEAESFTRDQQEKWARTFEAYLMTGKAPSLALVRPFTRFRIWLTGIYNQIQGIPEAALDPEISGIFDRMLATDREIASTKKQMGLQQLFRSPEEAGMSPAEWKSYVEAMADTDFAAAERVHASITREMLRELEAWWKDESAAIAKQIGDEYDDSPGWLAYRFVKLGETGGNPVLEAYKDLDLNKKAVLDALKGAGGYYSRTVLKKLVGKVTDKGVLTPEELGAVFGRSGTDILRDMLDLPSRERWVKEETARVMAERHGDIVAEQDRLKEEVADALHEGGQLHYLMHEYDVLYRRVNQSTGEGGAGLPVTSMELAAAEIVGSGQVLEVSAPRALGAERRASEQAFQAMAAGDYARALAAKQKQILSMLIYRESKDAREDMKRFEKLTDQMNDEKRRGTLGLADKAYLDISDAILWALRIRPVPTDPLALKGLKNLDDLENRLMLDGLEPAYARDVIEDVLNNPPVPPLGPTGKERPAWLALSVDQMREVMALLNQIKRAANQERRVQLGNQRMAVQAVASTIAGEAKANPDKGKQPGTKSAKGLWHGFQLFAQDVNSDLSQPQYIFERLGPTAEKFFWRRMNEAQREESRLFKMVYLAVEGMWKKLPAKDQEAMKRLLDVGDLPFPEDVDRDEASRNILWLIMVVANMGNASNKERLLKGYGWDENQVIAAMEKYLTHDQLAWVQGLWDLMDQELYPEMAAVYQRTNGTLPRKIEATPLTVTIDGVTRQYRGGYWPARYDPVAARHKRRAQAQAEGPMAKMLGGQSQATTMNRSFTKPRAEHFDDVINLEWEVLPAHLFDLIHYVATDEAARDMYRVMQNPDFQRAASHYLGQADVKAMDAWLKIFAAGPRVAQAAMELRGIRAAFGWTGSRFRMGVLGASMQTVLGDIPAPVIAMTDREVSALYMVPAMVSGMTGVGWFQMRNFAIKHSPWLQEAKEHWRRRAVEELGKPLRKAKAQKAREMLEFVRAAAWLPFEAMERTTSTIIWYAKYHQNLKVLGHDKAVAEADKTLEHLYPSHDPAKQAPIVRDRNSQIWNAFYSFFSTRYSQTRRTWHPAANRFLEADGVAGAVKVIPPASVAALQTIGGLLAMNVLSELLSGRGPEEDEEPLDWMLRKMLEGGFMLFPMGGEAFNIGKSIVPEIMGGKSVRINERAAPMAAALYAIGKALQKALDEDAPRFDRTLAVGETLAWFSKLPVSQIKRTTKYWNDPQDRSVTGKISGTIYGERKNQPKNIATMLGGRR